MSDPDIRGRVFGRALYLLCEVLNHPKQRARKIAGPLLFERIVSAPQLSKKLRNFLDRLGCFSLRSALASI
jgi:hypothetical protein